MHRKWIGGLFVMMAVWAAVPATAGLVTLGGSLDAFTDVDDGREDARGAVVDFGATSLAYTGPVSLGASTRVETQLTASSTGLLLDGLVVAETNGDNKATSGSIGSDITFTVDADESYRLVLEIGSDAGNVTSVVLANSNSISSPLFSSTTGPGTVMDTLALLEGQTYTLITEFDASVFGQSGSEMSRGEYELSLTLIPEPTAGGMIGLMGLALVCRRRLES